MKEKLADNLSVDSLNSLQQRANPTNISIFLFTEVPI